MDELSLEAAYEQWSPELVRYASFLASPIDAADIVADAFTDLLAGPESVWNSARSPKSFLFGVVTNVAREHHRATGRRQRRLERVAHRVDPSVAASVEMVFDDLKVERSIAALSLQQRAVIHLTYWHDMSVDDVAETLAVTTGTVRKQLARARAHLRKVL